MGSLHSTSSQIRLALILITKMKHFRIIQIVNVVAAVLFLVMGILLIMSFIFNLSLVDEMQQAANFDNWKAFIIVAGIISLFVAFVFLVGTWKEFQLYGGGYNSVVAETIYILGLGIELERPSTYGSEPTRPFVPAGEISSSSSLSSIFGFGFDDKLKWTFAGRKPFPRQDPSEEDGVDNEKEMKE